MSREKDVEALNKEIIALEAKLQDIMKKWQTYAQEVDATVKAILTEAGVWDKVRDMEVEKGETKKKAQQKLNETQAELQDKIKIRNYLLGRDNMEKGTDPPPMEETPEPPSFDDEPSDLDKEPEAPKLAEDEGKVVDLPSDEAKPEKPEPPEL